MVLINYNSKITNWIRLPDLREKIVEVRGKGGRLSLVGNLSRDCQLALLKSLEELEKCEITTAYRLSEAIESRAERITGHCSTDIRIELLGIYSIDPQTAKVLSKVLDNQSTDPSIELKN